MIVSPKIIVVSIKEVYNTLVKEMHIPVEKIMPDSYTTYLTNVINSNSHANEHLRFRESTEDPVISRHIY